jgi:hypothetical protein
MLGEPPNIISPAVLVPRGMGAGVGFCKIRWSDCLGACERIPSIQQTFTSFDAISGLLVLANGYESPLGSGEIMGDPLEIVVH